MNESNQGDQIQSDGSGWNVYLHDTIIALGKYESYHLDASRLTKNLIYIAYIVYIYNLFRANKVY